MYNYIYVNALIPMYRVLKLGVHITVTIREFSYLVTAVETLTPERLKALRVLGGQPWEIAITARHVESQSPTQPLGGSARRLRVPVDADLAWIKSAADPSVDLQKQQACSWEPGSAQEGSGVHDAVVTLCKQTKLLPAAVVIHYFTGRTWHNNLHCTQLN